MLKSESKKMLGRELADGMPFQLVFEFCNEKSALPFRTAQQLIQ